ncbi:MAG: RNA chaperone Hfq [Deltaproteobacteria bacterium]|nr:RNA chaperone Hfq [Deltaproteobacteria bacterium]
MPFQLAMGVAQGRVELSEALERMALQEKARRIQKDHELPWSLAVQIARGHVDQEIVLRRRRQTVYAAENPTRSVLDAYQVSGAPLRVALVGGEVVEGTIVSVEPYAVMMAPAKEQEAREIHKLSMLYAHPPADWKAIKKAIKSDKKVAALGLVPPPTPKDRYTISTSRLFRYLDTAAEVEVVLVSGDRLQGTVGWFSRFEISMNTKGGEVVVFRHALHEMGSV